MMKTEIGSLGVTKVPLMGNGSPKDDFLIEHKEIEIEPIREWIDGYGNKRSVTWSNSKWFDFKKVKKDQVVIFLKDCSETFKEEKEKKYCYVLIENERYIVDKDLISWSNNEKTT